MHKIADGTPLTLGMRVKDYDWNYGVIADTEHNRRALDKPHEFAGASRSTCVAWFHVHLDGGGMSIMDCSRLVRA